MIVGLGNPGTRYAKTRHNAGFLALDHFAGQLPDLVSWRSKYDGELAEGRVGSASVLLFKPMTFMNRSGGPVQKAMSANGIEPGEIIVLHDEVELSFGDVRLKKEGGHKGHNGIRDIMARLGHGDFFRIRLGVGRPERGEIASYLLSAFYPEELDAFKEMAYKSTREVENWIRDKVK
jgi:PTH1 family peptidyl-tRNA hydrolase